jgi:hypothetical protein
MPRLPKIPLEIAEPMIRKQLQELFLWVEHEFTPMDTQDLEMASFMHLKSVAASISSKFFAKSGKVKLWYHEAVALYELAQVFPGIKPFTFRHLVNSIEPQLFAVKHKNPQLHARS